MGFIKKPTSKKRVTIREKAFKEIVNYPGITSSRLKKKLQIKTSPGAYILKHVKNGLIRREYPEGKNKNIVRYFPTEKGLLKNHANNPQRITEFEEDIKIKQVELNINGEKKKHWEIEGIFYTDKEKAEEHYTKNLTQYLVEKDRKKQELLDALEKDREIVSNFLDKIPLILGISRNEEEALTGFLTRIEKTIDRVVSERNDLINEKNELMYKKSKEDMHRYERGAYR